MRLVGFIHATTIVKRHHADYKTHKQNQIRHDIEITKQVNRIKQDRITQLKQNKQVYVGGHQNMCPVSIKPYVG